MNDVRLPLDDPAHGAFCRSCGTGFPAGTAWCDACGRKLVSREEAEALAASGTMALLQAFPGDAEAAWARSALTARGIPSHLDAASSQFGSGAYLKARLSVPADRLEEAKAILAASRETLPDPEAERDREELSRARRVRYLRVVLGLTVAWSAFAAYVVARGVGGASGAVEIGVAIVWLVIFVVSFRRPRPAFASAMALGLVLLLLTVAASWAGPEEREPFIVILRQSLFVVFMYWGWQSASNRGAR